jgi:xylulokinase
VISLIRETLLMAIDIGTTSVKCIMMNQFGYIRSTASQGYPTFTPKSTWVEQEPEKWWSAVVSAIQQCVESVDPNQIEAISLSGHMSAPVLLDPIGKPVYPSILISDTRSRQQTTFLRQHFIGKFTSATGNEPLDAFTEERPDLFQRAETFVFPKDYIRFQLTGRLRTEPTDAGNSLLYDRQKKDCNRHLIDELELPLSLFPEIVGQQIYVVL